MHGAYVPFDYWVYVPQGILCDDTLAYAWATARIMWDKQQSLIDSGEYELELPWGNDED